MSYHTMIVRALSVLIGLCLSIPALAANTSYSDSSKLNVLRKYGAPTAVNQVTQSVSGNIGRIGAGDGGGWNDETDQVTTGAEIFTHTWLLPKPVTIDSWNVQMNTAPASINVEYSTNGGGTWNPWSAQAFTAGTTVANSTFTPGTVGGVNGIRYVATAGAGLIGNRMRLDEIRVFMPASLTVSLDEGYNLFTQPWVVTDATSTTTGAGPWQAPNGGNAAMMHNGLVRFDNELKNQVTNRSFVRWVLNDQTPITSATLGGSNGQDWNNWELYTANGTPTNPQTLGNTPAAIQAGGWTLQFSQGGTGVGGAPAFDFLLNTPGLWKNALLVWTTQGGGMQELEFHTNDTFPIVPEPSTFALLGLGALGLAIRTRRRRIKD